LKALICQEKKGKGRKGSKAVLLFSTEDNRSSFGGPSGWPSGGPSGGPSVG